MNSLPDETTPDDITPVVRFPDCVQSMYPPPGWPGVPPSTPLPWAMFRSEVLAMYEPPLRSKYTSWRIMRILDTVGALIGADGTTEALTPQLVARFVADRSATVGPNTVYSDVAALRTVCNYAESRFYLRVSPFRLRKSWVRRVPPSEKNARHYTREEIGRIIGRARSEAERKAGWAQWRAERSYALIATVAYTGLRLREALHLLAEDVKIDDGAIHLIPRDARGFKTEKSAQPVPIPPPLAPILAHWLPRTYSHWAFPNSNHDGPWLGGSPGYRPLDRLKRIAARAGVKGVTFKQLRHSWATHAEYFGLSAAMIQRVLRHTSERTQATYRHADIDNMRRSTERFDFGEGRHG